MLNVTYNMLENEGIELEVFRLLAATINQRANPRNQ